MKVKRFPLKDETTSSSHQGDEQTVTATINYTPYPITSMMGLVSLPTVHALIIQDQN